METSEKTPKPHIGRKISRIREIRGIKQEVLAEELGISQQSISKIEQSQTVEDETLEKVANVLGVTPEAIKNFNEEATINYINNTFNDNSKGIMGPAYYCSFDPLEKVVELYERLLKAEQEKVELLKGKNKD